jgi:hypothetical protein
MATRKKTRKTKRSTLRGRALPRMSRAAKMEMMEGYSDEDLRGIRGAGAMQKRRAQLYSAAAKKDKRTLLALMAQKSRGLRKAPRGNAPDRYTITGRASSKGKPGSLVLTLAKTGSKTCAVRDAQRAQRWGYKSIKVYDDYAKKTIGWRAK